VFYYEFNKKDNLHEFCYSRNRGEFITCMNFPKDTDNLESFCKWINQCLDKIEDNHLH